MKRASGPTVSEVVREYLLTRVEAAGRGGQTALAGKMGLVRQQLHAALRGDTSVMLKHLDSLLASEAISSEDLLSDLAQVARRMKRRKA
jgi:hypothetical protein